LIIDASVVREEIWGFEYLDAQSSDNWSGYFGGWTYDPPACAFLEKGALEAPAGWVMAYGTGPDEQEFFKQQVAIFDSVASAEAVFEEFHAVHDQCWQFRRDQGGGRAYDMTVTVATWDYLAGYPYVAVNVSANGAPARWNSDIVMVRAGNAVIWVNSGTYGDSESGSSSFTLLESELPALIAGL
jgi:hypothetical protein